MSGSIPAGRLRRIVASARDGADPATVLGAVLVAVLLLQMWGTVRTEPQQDYWQIRAVGRATAGVSDIYSAQARVEIGSRLQADLRVPGTSSRELQAGGYWSTLQTTGTPTLYALAGFLQTGDYDVDTAVFTLLSLAAILAAMVWMCRKVRIGAAGTLVAIGILLVASYPLWLDLYVGNLNSLQVGILVLYLAIRARPVTTASAVLGGLVLGAAIILKPNLALVAALLAVELVARRDWRDLAGQGVGLAAGGILALAVAFARFGSLAPWPGWLATFSDLAVKAGYPTAWGNASLVRLVREQDGADVTLLLLGGLMLVVVVLLAIVPRAPAGRGSAVEDTRWGRETLVSGAAVAITLLATPIAWQHYYLLLTPLAIFLVRPAGARFGGTGGAFARQGVVAVAFVLLSLQPVRILGLQPDTTFMLLSSVTATVLLLGAALVELAAPAPMPGAGRAPEDAPGSGAPAGPPAPA